MQEFFLAFIPIFVAVDAIGLLPILVNLMQGCDVATKRKIILEAMLTALAVSIGFVLAGQAIFRFLGVSVGDFMIAGGIILFCIAIRDLLAVQKRRQIPAIEMGAVPIGTPLIAGPGLLTTSLMLNGQYGFWLTALCLVVNILIAGALFFGSEKIIARMSVGGIRAISKVVSLFLAAIAIMMIRKGFAQLPLS